jgi:Icc-related predicted phosphoesterase
MRVAALYDIHGNLPALDAVLAEVGDVDAIVGGGDITEGPSRARRSSVCWHSASAST